MKLAIVIGMGIVMNYIMNSCQGIEEQGNAVAISYSFHSKGVLPFIHHEQDSALQL